MCGDTVERRMSNAPNDGATTSGVALPGARAATLISTTSHAAAASGACTTIANCATSASAWITSPFLQAAARRDSVFASWLGRRALHGPHCRAAVRLVVGRDHLEAV